MDRKQADVVSKAILDPKLKELEANKDRKLKKQQLLRTQKKVGAFALLGLAIGYAIGLSLQGDIFIFGSIGFGVGLVGAIVALKFYMRT